MELYVRDRFLEPLVTGSAIAQTADWWYQLARWVVIAAAAMAPTFLTLGTETKAEFWRTSFKVIGITLSLLVAVVGAGLAARRVIGVSRIFGTYSRQLERLGWKYASNPPLQGEQAAAEFSAFRDDVESEVARFNKQIESDLIKADEDHPLPSA